ncbi:efflux RND transporter periplasmic adaptor subunit [Nereida sp. MMG025]|uniref:efflux RND transporter periplasmic adaptor subunit n=1 Tax=Nereida sp. MMG025 TaxID=2909981 RepID=UPI001EFFF80A|nr:efflux RND transporter periplasmic adaptor subunit [Nereida sp. MMG025]MCF6445417.1 efflux RND transporter periplasmic adaptor subunit [Nereida sp. MMG025]
MKFFSFVTAILVCAFLYGLVFERDTLMALAQSGAQDTGDAAQDDGIQRVAVVALKSQAQAIDSAVLVRGRTEAARQVDVKAEISGRVISAPLRKGAFVEEGAEMCVLDPGTSQARLAEAEARLAEARANMPTAQSRLPEAQSRLREAQARLEEARINQNAATRLSEGGFASDTRVATADANYESALAAIQSAEAGIQSAQGGIESAQAAVRSAEAAVASATKDVERQTIKAPFSGLLESDTAELGALLQPGMSCATIIQLDPVKLVGFVPETQVDRIAVGAVGGARLTGGEEVQGRVTFLSRSADPVTRTFRVDIEVPNADLHIRDGQTVEMIIASDGADAHLVPGSALTLNDEGTLGLRIVEDGITRFAPVSVIRDTVDGIWVDGLPPQVDVIVLGQEYVTDGVPVDVTYREAQG